jgi:hypothetical protein
LKSSHDLGFEAADPDIQVKSGPSSKPGRDSCVEAHVRKEGKPDPVGGEELDTRADGKMPTFEAANIPTLEGSVAGRAKLILLDPEVR